MNEWEWRLLEDRPPVEAVPHPGGPLRCGARVRLRPRPGGDAFDILLAGKTAVVESIEQDYEGCYHLAVVLDEDPGRDLGFMRQPGHRFFYAPGEVELCAADEAIAPPAPVPSAPPAVDAPILIAGIGNIFLGDDGFGVDVVRRLQARELPANVRVVDFGIRSLDLAYALMEARGVTILVDACPRGAPPGTLFVIEPALDAADTPHLVDAHAMNPQSVIRLARALGGAPGSMLVLGCEPATLGPEEGQLGLSPEVAAVVDDAAELALSLVRRLRAGEWPGEPRRPSA